MGRNVDDADPVPVPNEPKYVENEPDVIHALVLVIRIRAECEDRESGKST